MLVQLQLKWENNSHRGHHQSYL